MGLRILLIFEICLLAIVCRAVALDKDPSAVASASKSGDETKIEIAKANDQVGVKNIEQTDSMSQVVRKGRQLPLSQQIDSVKNCVDQMYSGLAASRTGSPNFPYGGSMPPQYYPGWPSPSPWSPYPFGSSAPTPGNMPAGGMTPFGSSWSNSPTTSFGSMPSTQPDGPMSSIGQNHLAGYAAPSFSNALTGSSGRQIAPFNPERAPTGSYSASGYPGAEMSSLSTGGYPGGPVDALSPERTSSGGYSSPMSPSSQAQLSGYSGGQFQTQQNYPSGIQRAADEPLPPATQQELLVPQSQSMSQGPTMQQQMLVQPQMPNGFSGIPVPQMNPPPQTPFDYSQLPAEQGMLTAPQLPSTDLNIPSGPQTLSTGSAVGGARSAFAPPTNIASYNSQPAIWMAAKPRPSPAMSGGGASYIPLQKQIAPAPPMVNSAQGNSPCPMNYLISCGPNLQPVPCS